MEGFDHAAYHKNLPDRIRVYLRAVRGISDAAIDHHFLGWDGHRITIPVFNRDGLFSFFKLAKDPEDHSDNPKMLAPPGTKAELYGWERIRMKPERIVICEGEFDRLVLESRGIAAVTSTGGAQVFRSEWAEAFKDIAQIYLAFDNDDAGRAGTERVARLIPHAKVVSWPKEIGEGGDVTDYFVRLNKRRENFLSLVETAQPLSVTPLRAEPPATPESQETRPPTRDRSEIDDLKSRIPLQDLVSRYVILRPSGANFTGCCPFHDDQKPSFVVYPVTRSFHCFGCKAHGDALTFLMRQDGLTFPQAVETLKQLST